mmetsp:Transcript_12537/g.41345  ORF Transcript_12537/g.41345 Transcript_12537/m.41345 type:complete len:285 (-) Transcript_12537:299-1153(-)
MPTTSSGSPDSTDTPRAASARRASSATGSSSRTCRENTSLATSAGAHTLTSTRISRTTISSRLISSRSTTSASTLRASHASSWCSSIKASCGGTKRPCTQKGSRSSSARRRSSSTSISMCGLPRSGRPLLPRRGPTPRTRRALDGTRARTQALRPTWRRQRPPCKRRTWRPNPWGGTPWLRACVAAEVEAEEERGWLAAAQKKAFRRSRQCPRAPSAGSSERRRRRPRLRGPGVAVAVAERPSRKGSGAALRSRRHRRRRPLPLKHQTRPRWMKRRSAAQTAPS